MPKKIGAIGSDDDRKDIDFNLQMANNPRYQQMLEQKRQAAMEVKDLQQIQQQQVRNQQAKIAEEQQRLQDAQNINAKPANGENITGSVYTGKALNAKPASTYDDGIRKLNNNKEAEIVRERLISAKNDIPKIDGELNQKLSFAATDGTPVRDAVKIMDSVQTEIKKNDDIAQQYVTQAETLLSQYANTTMVHETKHDKELGNQTKDSTHKFNADANLSDNSGNQKPSVQDKKVLEELMKNKLKGHH